MGFKSHIWKKKHRVSPEFARVARDMGRPAWSIGFGRVIVPASLLKNLDQSSHQVDQVLGRLAGLVRV
jgi:hypothetical protein